MSDTESLDVEEGSSLDLQVSRPSILERSLSFLRQHEVLEYPLAYVRIIITSLSVLYIVIATSALWGEVTCRAAQPSEFAGHEIKPYHIRLYALFSQAIVALFNFFMYKYLLQWQSRAANHKAINTTIWFEQSFYFALSIPVVSTVFDVNESWIVLLSCILILFMFACKYSSELTTATEWIVFPVIIWIVVFAMIFSFQHKRIVGTKYTLGVLLPLIATADIVLFLLPVCRKISAPKTPVIVGSLFLGYLFFFISMSLGIKCKKTEP